MSRNSGLCDCVADCDKSIEFASRGETKSVLSYNKKWDKWLGSRKYITKPFCTEEDILAIIGFPIAKTVADFGTRGQEKGNP